MTAACKSRSNPWGLRAKEDLYELHGEVHQMSELAEELLNKKENTKLENHFASTLKTSTDIKLFRVYIKYVMSQGKTSDLVKVYEFILKKLYHHWDIFPLIGEYLKVLNNDPNLDDEEKIEKTRTMFHMFFLTPMNNFNSLWKEYDKFENDLNKNTAKKIFTEVLPAYQKTFRLYTLYKALLNYSPRLIQDTITSDLFFDVIELESRNVAFFSEDHLRDRMVFLFKFFSERFQNEEIYFTWAEYYKRIDKVSEAMAVVKNGIANLDNNVFLYCFYSTISKDNLFEDIIKKKMDLEKEDKIQNDDLDILMINYLSYTLKNNGLESFRELFREFIKYEIGPYVYIYVAKAEYFTFQNKEISFRIFTKALIKYPNHEALQHEFLFFLLKTNDLINARAFFERFNKTIELCEAMMEYEFNYGDNEKFRETIKLYDSFEKNKKKCSSLINYKNVFEREYNLFRKYIYYFESEETRNAEIDAFLEKIANVNFPVVNTDSVIEILKLIEI